MGREEKLESIRLVVPNAFNICGKMILQMWMKMCFWLLNPYTAKTDVTLVG